MILLDLLLRPAFVSDMLVPGPNRCGPVSTSGGKEMARGITKEDTLAVLYVARRKRRV